MSTLAGCFTFQPILYAGDHTMQGSTKLSVYEQAILGKQRFVNTGPEA